MLSFSILDGLRAFLQLIKIPKLAYDKFSKTIIIVHYPLESEMEDNEKITHTKCCSDFINFMLRHECCAKSQREEKSQFSSSVSLIFSSIQFSLRNGQKSYITVRLKSSRKFSTTFSLLMNLMNGFLSFFRPFRQINLY